MKVPVYSKSKNQTAHWTQELHRLYDFVSTTFLQRQNYWDKETEHIHKEEYYSATKSKEVLIGATEGMNPQNITLSERSQTEDGHIFMV